VPPSLSSKEATAMRHLNATLPDANPNQVKTQPHKSILQSNL